MEPKYDAPMKKYPFIESQILTHDFRLVDVLCRANLFANDKDLN